MSGSKHAFCFLAAFAVSHSLLHANLISDPGFESGSSSALWGGSAVINSEARSGTYAARLNENDPTWGGGYERTISGLNPGSTYTFSAYVKTVGGAVAVGVKNYGAAQVTESVNSAGYVLVEVDFVTGELNTSATLFIYNGLGDATLAYADDLSLTGGEPLIPPLPALPQPTGPYELVFSDEFNTVGPVDLTKWKPEVGFKRNNEDQYYTGRVENLYQTGGNLVITAKRESFLNEFYDAGSGDWRLNQQYATWTSGSIQTVDSFDFLYGKIECRAKVTNLPGTWPAIWTVGAGQEWPAGGEIDIMENYGGKILGNFATAASGRWVAAWDAANVSVSSLGAGWVNSFHTWELEWSPTHAEIRLDGAVINTFDPSKKNHGSSYAHPGVAPFQTFGQLLWLNLAIGGNAGGDPSGLPDETTYLVDYIRVYQRQHVPYVSRLEMVDAADTRVDFQSVEGRRYTVQESSDLVNWNDLTNLRGSGRTMSHTHAGGAASTEKFYRVKVDNSQWIDGDTP